MLALYKYCMYKLDLRYNNEPIDEILKDAYTLCAVATLLADHSIDCCVSSSTCLEFDTERDRFMASLALSGNSQFSVVYVD